eukprot:COSAG01_NODE_28674_length_655_cov_5.183453_1_plen_30_part_01
MTISHLLEISTFAEFYSIVMLENPWKIFFA